MIPCDGIQHRFDRVPLRKIVNWILVEASAVVRPAKPWGMPTHLQIEPANRCNLKCALCPVTKGMDRPSGVMEAELFRRIIDETGDYLFLILLWDWGEPFINPDIYEMISYAKDKRIQIITSSNGHFFADPEQAEKVVRSGLDTLIFAVDGITQETYERYRCNGKLETVFQGIRNVVEKKRILGSQTPLINLRFIVMEHNEHEIIEAKKLAQSLGVDVFTLRTMHSFERRIATGQKPSTSEFLPKNPQYRRFSQDASTGERIHRKRNPCKAIWNNSSIHWNGAICPCTFDADEKNVMGWLNKESFKEIWTGPNYRDFRRRFRENYREIDLCSECTNAYEGGTCSTEDIMEAYFFPGNSDGK